MDFPYGGVNIRFEATLRGLNQYTSKLSDSQLFEFVYSGLEELLQHAQAAVRNMIPPDTGGTANRIFYEINGVTVRDLNGVVASPDEYFVVLDQGRRPGARMPPHAPLEAWGERHGIYGHNAIYMLRKRIAARGLPAHHIMAAALAQTQERARGVFVRRWIEHFGPR